MKDMLFRHGEPTPAPAPLPDAPRRTTAQPHVPFDFAGLSIGLPESDGGEEYGFAETLESTDAGAAGETLEYEHGGGEAVETVGGDLGADCGSPTRLGVLRSGTFRNNLKMDDYFPDLVGQGFWKDGGTAGPFQTPQFVGSKVQVMGVIPPGCSPGSFRLGQTVEETKNVVDGVHSPFEGQTYDDFQRSGRNPNRPPLRRDWQSELGTHISMGDPPSRRLGPRNVELDRNFVTTLTGPSGSPMTETWSTSIRIQNGAVTRNTIS
jgi:hypothetical protein